VAVAVLAVLAVLLRHRPLSRPTPPYLRTGYGTGRAIDPARFGLARRKAGGIGTPWKTAAVAPSPPFRSVCRCD